MLNRDCPAATPAGSGLLLACVAALAFASDASAEAVEARTALVIGNSAYESSPLANPRNDARDLGETLEKLGFEVEIRIDQTKEQMTHAIFEFGDRLRERGGVGFFYYAGHGMEVAGENYLIPVGAEIPGERYVKLRGVPMGEVTAGLANAHNRMNIVVLDACRNNPFARSWRSSSRGLAVMYAPAETLIAYATEPGSVAADGVGARNSPYAKALIDAIQKPGVRLVDVFRDARLTVIEETQRQQTPWQSDNLTADAFYFLPPEPTRLAAVRPNKGGAGFSIEDLDSAASEEAAKREWAEQRTEMETAFSKAKALDERKVSSGLKKEAWERFLEAYPQDDPYSVQDDDYRREAAARIEELTRSAEGEKEGANPQATSAWNSSLGPAQLEAVRVDWRIMERKASYHFAETRNGELAPQVSYSLQVCKRISFGKNWFNRCAPISNSDTGNTNQNPGGMKANQDPQPIRMDSLYMTRNDWAEADRAVSEALLVDAVDFLVERHDGDENKINRDRERGAETLRSQVAYAQIVFIQEIEGGFFSRAKRLPVGCQRIELNFLDTSYLDQGRPLTKTVRQGLNSCDRAATTPPGEGSLFKTASGARLPRYEMAPIQPKVWGVLEIQSSSKGLEQLRISASAN